MWLNVCWTEIEAVLVALFGATIISILTGGAITISIAVILAKRGT